MVVCPQLPLQGHVDLISTPSNRRSQWPLTSPQNTCLHLSSNGPILPPSFSPPHLQKTFSDFFAICLFVSARAPQSLYVFFRSNTSPPMLRLNVPLLCCAVIISGRERWKRWREEKERARYSDWSALELVVDMNIKELYSCKQVRLPVVLSTKQQGASSCTHL